MPLRLPYDPPEALRVLRRGDAKLARLIERVGQYTLKLRPDRTPFEVLLRSVVFQQLSGKVAHTIHQRLTALLPPSPVQQPEALLRLDEAALRGAGLSRNKIAAVRDLAQKTCEGLVPDRRRLARLDDEEIVERLVQIRGVGRWTVEMLLLFWLGRPDVLPVTDFGVRKGYHLTFGRGEELPHPSAIARRGERWRPYRSVASWYLWRAVDLARSDGASKTAAPLW